jgi:hypothetical protein
MSARTLPPVSEDLAARLRAAAAAVSPSDARTWVPPAPTPTGLLRVLIQAICPPVAGWCRQA